MKKHETLLTVLVLFAASAALYLLQFWLFHDSRDTLFYMLQDWAFLPVQVALVSVIVGRILSARERQERMARTVLLASSFFHDFGAALLRRLACCIECGGEPPQLHMDEHWRARDFCAAAQAVRSWRPRLAAKPGDFASLKQMLGDTRLSLLVIASNPALLEHEDFSDMLLAIFHLSDELNARADFAALTPQELQHLNDDLRRLTVALTVNWVGHMQHMQAEYPVLFLVEAADGPFDALCADAKA